MVNDTPSGSVWLRASDFSSVTAVLTSASIASCHTKANKQYAAGFEPYFSDWLILCWPKAWTCIFALLVPVFVLPALVINSQIYSRWLSYLIPQGAHNHTTTCVWVCFAMINRVSHLQYTVLSTKHAHTYTSEDGDIRPSVEVWLFFTS